MPSARGTNRLIIAMAVVLAVTGRMSAQDLGVSHDQYDPADVAIGLRAYSSLCAGCHGPNGDGIGTVNLRTGPLPRASTDAALRAVITNGIPASGMPAFRLEPADTTGLVAYIRVGFNPSATSVALGDATRGRAVVEGQGQCLSCHRVGGRGAFTAPDLTDVGAARTPAAMQRTLLDPTSSMLPINRPVRAVLRDGKVIQGRRLNEDTYTVQLMNDQGRLVSLLKSELREWTVSPTSTMPSYRATLTPQEISDVIGYLVTLKVARQ